MAKAKPTDDSGRRKSDEPDPDQTQRSPTLQAAIDAAIKAQDQSREGDR
jgi:hypothetical protein